MMRILLSGSLALSLVAAEPTAQGLSLEQAIRATWTKQEGLKASQAMVEARRAEAESYGALRLPTVTLQAQGVYTNEPMMAFGLRLNQARIGPADFAPDRLNHPDGIAGLGASAVVQQPLYAGGRLQAAERAGRLMAEAEEASQERRQQEAALATVQAYFGIQVADQALRWAEDTRLWMQGLQTFVEARVKEGLMLDSERLRLVAAMAQVEAQKAEAQRQLLAAQSGLGLLLGEGPLKMTLATPLIETEPAPKGETSSASRGDLRALNLQAQAAQAGAKAATGALRPEVGLELGAGTMRQNLSQGGNWTWAGVGVKWKVFAAPERAKASAARAQERAATLMVAFKQRQAEHEQRVAEGALVTAKAQVSAARSALQAAEEARRLRELRHREGLAPLIDVLDAEAALQGARTLLLQSLYAQRVSRASLDLATGHPIEGVKP